LPDRPGDPQILGAGLNLRVRPDLLSAGRGSGGFTSYLVGVTSCSPVYDRVVERRRAVALARHFREAEGLSIAEIAARLGRSPATIKAYF
jgi:Homeodomain-like domain